MVAHQESRGLQTANTCAFDCLHSIYASGVAYDIFESVDLTNSSFMAFVRKTLQCATRKLSKAIEKKRNLLLESIYDPQYFGGSVTKLKKLKYIDCETNIGALFMHMITNGNEGLASVEIKKLCEQCNVSRTLHHSVVELQQRLALRRHATMHKNRFLC